MEVPFGRAVVVDVADGAVGGVPGDVVEVTAAVGGGVVAGGRVAALPVVFVEAAARPSPVTAAARTAAAPATMAMTAPRGTASSEPSVATGDRASRVANQVSRAGAPAAPASTMGVQANTKTMSAPV